MILRWMYDLDVRVWRVAWWTSWWERVLWQDLRYRLIVYCWFGPLDGNCCPASSISGVLNQIYDGSCLRCYEKAAKWYAKRWRRLSLWEECCFSTFLSDPLILKVRLRKRNRVARSDLSSRVALLLDFWSSSIPHCTLCYQDNQHLALTTIIFHIGLFFTQHTLYWLGHLSVHWQGIQHLISTSAPSSNPLHHGWDGCDRCILI